MAAGDFNGELKLFDVCNVRGWATSDAEIANQYRQQGLEVEEIVVPVRRLDSLCAEFAEQQIHFLKIDVEGFEREVLLGMDFQKWRPWILIIEATRPNSQQTQYQSWEPMLIENQYCYAYNDGLNRYYVAQEHSELIDMLAVQPNVFDDYQFIGYHRIEQALPGLLADNKALNQQLKIFDGRLQRLLADNKALNQQLKIFDGRLQQALQVEQQLTNQLIAINNSLSWRITQPLRRLKYNIIKLINGLRQLQGKALKKILNITPTKVKRFIKAILYRIRLKTHRIKESNQSNLSPRAADIYVKLQKTVKERAN
jgi:hypothetical protein